MENLGKNPENIPGKVLGKILGKSRKISWKILGKNPGKILGKIQEKSRYNPGKNTGKIPGKIQSISVHGWRLEWTEKVFQNDKSSWKKVRKKKITALYEVTLVVHWVFLADTQNQKKQWPQILFGYFSILHIQLKMYSTLFSVQAG